MIVDIQRTSIPPFVRFAMLMALAMSLSSSSRAYGFRSKSRAGTYRYAPGYPISANLNWRQHFACVNRATARQSIALVYGVLNS
jgi:hypothetical protein